MSRCVVWSILSFGGLASGLDDSAMVQKQLHVHSEQEATDALLELDRMTEEELNATLDSFTLRRIMEQQDAYLTQFRFHGAAFLQKQLHLRDGVQATPQRVAMELAKNDTLPKIKMEDLPTEIQEMVGHARLALPSARVFLNALPLLQERVPATSAVRESELENVGRRAQAVLAQWRKGGPFIEELLGMVPRMYQMLQDKEIFSPLAPLLKGYDANNQESLKKIAALWEEFAGASTRTMRLFRAEGEPRGNASRIDPCHGNASESYSRGEVSTGVKYFPTDSGYYLTLEAGSGMAWYRKSDIGEAVPCYDDAFLIVGLQRKNESGVNEGFSATMSFKGSDRLPLTSVKQTSLSVLYSVEEPFTPVPSWKPQNTTIFTAKLGPGFQAGPIYSDGTVAMRHLPRVRPDFRQTPTAFPDESGGWTFVSFPRFGIETLDGSDAISFQSTAGVYPKTDLPPAIAITQTIPEDRKIWPF